MWRVGKPLSRPEGCGGIEDFTPDTEGLTRNTNTYPLPCSTYTSPRVTNGQELMSCSEWCNWRNVMRSSCCFRWQQMLLHNLWTQTGKPLSLLIMWTDQSECHFIIQYKTVVFFCHHNAIIAVYQIRDCIIRCPYFQYCSVYMSQHSLVGVLLPCCSTRGYYQLEFKGSFHKKPTPGPSVNLTVIPDPSKPVSLSVEYDTKAKFPAGGKFPGWHLYFLSVCGALVSLYVSGIVSVLSN